MENGGREALEDVVIQALGHRERRNILKIVRASERGASYTEIAAELGINTGRMNYHLRQLQGLMERDGERRYHLTPLGEQSMSLLNNLTEDPSGRLEAYLGRARLSQSSSIHPTVTGLLYVGMAFDVLFLIIWGYMGYLVAVGEGPMFLLPLVSVLFILGMLGLVGIARALKTAPAFVRRLERRLGVT
jgi:AcrR family transcriptional regulator